MAVVWSDFWPADAESTARRSASLIGSGEQRVRHFYEPERLLGKAVGRSLGWEDPDEDANAAWDIYLYYPAGVRWDDAMPPPSGVLHQLSNRRDDPAFRTGDPLVQALREATQAALAAKGKA